MGVAELGRCFSVEKAHKAQLLLSKKIIFEDKLPKEIRYVAGVDVAYVNDLAIGAVAVLDYANFNLVESQTVTCKSFFPYIPTLLSFREVPSTVRCAKRLSISPDVFLVDGHGFAHPYQCGFASHFGIVLGKPTIGVAKKRLIGEFEYEDLKNRNYAYLKHQGKIVGAALKTLPEHKPVYVSVGHMVSLETAIKIVKNCVCNSNIPEPIVKAHEIATKERKKLNSSSCFGKMATLKT